MSEAEFWNCTPRYFAACQKAWIERQRREWERARFTGWLSVLPHVSHKRGGLKITELYPFEWDEKPKPFAMDEVDKERLLRFEQHAKKIFEKQFGAKFDSAPEPKATNGNHQ